jgi:hypothetical protein
MTRISGVRHFDNDARMSARECKIATLFDVKFVIALTVSSVRASIHRMTIRSTRVMRREYK